MSKPGAGMCKKCEFNVGKSNVAFPRHDWCGYWGRRVQRAALNCTKYGPGRKIIEAEIKRSENGFQQTKPIPS